MEYRFVQARRYNRFHHLISYQIAQNMPPKKAAPKKAPAKKAPGKKGPSKAPEPQLGRGKREKKPVIRLGVDDEWGLTGEYLEVKKPSSSDEESIKSEAEPQPEEEPEKEAPKPTKERRPRKKKNVSEVVNDPDAAMQDPDPVEDAPKSTGKGKRPITDVDEPEEPANSKVSKPIDHETPDKLAVDLHPGSGPFTPVSTPGSPAWVVPPIQPTPTTSGRNRGHGKGGRESRGGKGGRPMGRIPSSPTPAAGPKPATAAKPAAGTKAKPDAEGSSQPAPKTVSKSNAKNKPAAASTPAVEESSEPAPKTDSKPKPKTKPAAASKLAAKSAAKSKAKPKPAAKGAKGKQPEKKDKSKSAPP